MPVTVSKILAFSVFITITDTPLNQLKYEKNTNKYPLINST